MKTVLLADDHPLFRAGVRQVLEETGRFQVMAEVRDGDAAMAQLEILRPDIAVLDLSMPGLSGFEVLERSRQAGIPTRMVILSMHAEQAYAARARAAGAQAFVAKEDAAAELIRALDTADTFFMSQSVGVSGPADLPPGDAADRELVERLTESERRVLRLLAKGWTSKQIGRGLGISPRTVQAHRRNAAERLGIMGPNQLMQFAVRHLGAGDDETGEGS
ncbi:MAG: response regulator transcription factor [Burkholderiaceae bacterium]|nr:response regulator transcription factor [Burkholderiaceae bacterium]